MRSLVFAPVVASLCLAASVAQAAGFTLTSPEVKPNATIDNAQVYDQFGCHGGNTSPALKWSGAPKGTKSFALTLYDPDAPSGSGWWHWIVYDLSASTTELPAGAGATGGKSLPAGAAMGPNDFGEHAYGGPCPPAGDKPHHYVFTIYALKTDKLDVPPNASAAWIGFTIHDQKLGSAKLTAKYGRK
jgi:Raf kinase inhibitor-like YbhB/YbcL family protein